jgi:hypothetical protein
MKIDFISSSAIKRCRLKHFNFQIINDMSKENKTIIEELFGNDFIADVSNSSTTEYYQVYLNGIWIADCADYCEAETIANANVMNGRIDIERTVD